MVIKLDVRKIVTGSITIDDLFAVANLVHHVNTLSQILI